MGEVFVGEADGGVGVVEGCGGEEFAEVLFENFGFDAEGGGGLGVAVEHEDLERTGGGGGFGGHFGGVWRCREMLWEVGRVKGGSRDGIEGVEMVRMLR